jgi:pSer/pThr/pTyr-binding forkhead associated (FHA) protein
MHALLIKSGKHAGKKLSLPANREIIIGRDDDCQIRLATSDVSRRHCSIQLTKDGLSIKDLGSRNGTIVNGKLISETTEVKIGDTIELGPMLFEVVGPSPESKPVSTDPTGSAAPTEDSIADWLAEEAQDGGGSTSSTTIISTDSPEYAAIKSAAAAQRTFKSVAEEGADIIRRHLEKAEQHKSGSG